jgi:hypothetical protein
MSDHGLCRVDVLLGGEVLDPALEKILAPIKARLLAEKDYSNQQKDRATDDAQNRYAHDTSLKWLNGITQ